MKHTADKRLSAVAGFVKNGGVLADIGTDHAKLPVSLLLADKISFAYLCDINEGPLAAARSLAAEAGVADKTELVLTDGLRSLPLEKITDISICGMGGELISDILENSLCLEYARINFILNPMSRDEALRKYLSEKGFIIEKETAAVQTGRVYTIMKVRYTGVPYERSEAWYYIGETEADENGRRYMEKALIKLRNIACNPAEAERVSAIAHKIEEKLK